MAPRKITTLGLSIPERFWLFVNKSDGCWLWNSMKRPSGYGYLKVSIGKGSAKFRKHAAHRLSWEIHFGPIPDGLQICHKCDVRACVRPDHLFLGTAKDNIVDAARKGRMSRGTNHSRHKLTEDQVRAIRASYPGRSQQSIADEFGVSQLLVSLIVRRKSWAWLP